MVMVEPACVVKPPVSMTTSKAPVSTARRAEAEFRDAQVRASELPVKHGESSFCRACGANGHTEFWARLATVGSGVLFGVIFHIQ